jgi:hypothetical protein
MVVGLTIESTMNMIIYITVMIKRGYSGAFKKLIFSSIF